MVGEVCDSKVKEIMLEAEEVPGRLPYCTVQ
jgi:hypothetical protein